VSISALLTAASLAVLALLLLFTMAEVALRELRRFDTILSRRGIRLAERALLAIVAGAAIFTAYPTSAEKRGQGESPGDGQSSREQPDRSGTGGVEIGNPAAPSNAPTFPAWTNMLDSLAFTGIAVVGNEAVLLYVIHYSGGGSGCFVTHYKSDIQQAMNDLVSGYPLEEMDLSEYQKLPH
jgi:hypothetical protein